MNDMPQILSLHGLKYLQYNRDRDYAQFSTFFENIVSDAKLFLFSDDNLEFFVVHKYVTALLSIKQINDFKLRILAVFR